MTLSTPLSMLGSFIRRVFCGGIIVDYEIERYCQQFGLLTPFKPQNLNPASIDVEIGTTAEIEMSNGQMLRIDLEKYSKEYPYMMEPGEFMLVATDEEFNIPDFLCCEFRIKSSRAREAYDNLLAVWIDPGFNKSKLTLELVNHRQRAKLPIYPGLKIGQIVFHRCAKPRKSYRTTGRYNGHSTVHGSLG